MSILYSSILVRLYLVPTYKNLEIYGNIWWDDRFHSVVLHYFQSPAATTSLIAQISGDLELFLSRAGKNMDRREGTKDGTFKVKVNDKVRYTSDYMFLLWIITLPCYTWMNYNNLSVRSQTWWLVISEGNHSQMAASFSYFQIRELFQVSQYVSFNMTIVLLIWSGHSQRDVNEQRLVWIPVAMDNPLQIEDQRGHTHDQYFSVSLGHTCYSIPIIPISDLRPAWRHDLDSGLATDLGVCENFFCLKWI